mmetsp:Transcript_922/g.1926  ORF Transcript_922/g.1926 Transcript_922/m.1926 type:complete len:217 (-) Transcript_922:597-1247(-)
MRYGLVVLGVALELSDELLVRGVSWVHEALVVEVGQSYFRDVVHVSLHDERLELIDIDHPVPVLVERVEHLPQLLVSGIPEQILEKRPRGFQVKESVVGLVGFPEQLLGKPQEGVAGSERRVQGDAVRLAEVKVPHVLDRDAPLGLVVDGRATRDFFQKAFEQSRSVACVLHVVQHRRENLLVQTLLPVELQLQLEVFQRLAGAVRCGGRVGGSET